MTVPLVKYSVIQQPDKLEFYCHEETMFCCSGIHDCIGVYDWIRIGNFFHGGVSTFRLFGVDNGAGRDSGENESAENLLLISYKFLLNLIWFEFISFGYRANTMVIMPLRECCGKAEMFNMQQVLWARMSVRHPVSFIKTSPWFTCWQTVKSPEYGGIMSRVINVLKTVDITTATGLKRLN